LVARRRRRALWARLLYSPGFRTCPQTGVFMPQAPAHADLIIQASWIAPVEGPARLLTDHAIVISGTRIQDILPASEASRRWQATETLRLEGHLLMPGLVNAHTHAAMNLFRGLA